MCFFKDAKSDNGYLKALSAILNIQNLAKCKTMSQMILGQEGPQVLNIV